jgi:hypothetical protein
MVAALTGSSDKPPGLNRLRGSSKGREHSNQISIGKKLKAQKDQRPFVFESESLYHGKICPLFIPVCRALLAFSLPLFLSSLSSFLCLALFSLFFRDFNAPQFEIEKPNSRFFNALSKKEKMSYR